MNLYDQVMDVRKKDDGKEYAMKMLKANGLRREDRYMCARFASCHQRARICILCRERNILAMVSHPFLVRLHFSFEVQCQLPAAVIRTTIRCAG